MTVRVYRHDDPSAPVLSGQAGALITVLDACLVNGYTGKPAAGWAKVLSGTNKAVYRYPNGNKHYLRIDDTASGSAMYARIRGFAAMTDVDTGTDPFPTDVQLAGGAYLHKSSAVDAVGRGWIVVATGAQVYIYVACNNFTLTGSASTNILHFFGDITSYKVGDAYHSFLMAASTGTIGGQATGTFSGVLATSQAGHFLCRSYTQVGSSALTGKFTDYVRSNSAGYFGNAGVAYPDPVSGGMLLAPVWINESATSITRGLLPGLWNPMHNLSTTTPSDTLTGAGELAGKTFIILAPASAGSIGRCCLEISDTW